ncbi:FAD/FMN-containing dehydrogenase [Catalinimonas alkaloidigena]|uniref:FAD/FMN-containing dehydrogenase n=1 Tax=Catalinimonas alkaloidigena TaxID=1075417 RepID=A0A1G9FBC6_9BACT|nr:D-arabinono-1,4-lactone oxidase [Catalinimonas alkaloidigena]SDK85641.1 FAD/FMN-containing dehydrogenase [Catalinimonas alkaloidigena]
MLTLSILLQFLGKLIFQRKQLPDYLESVDDRLTHHCTNAQREQVIRHLNWMLRRRRFQRFIENTVNHLMPSDERLIFDTGAYEKRANGYLPPTETRVTWSNWIGSQQLVPLRFLVPGNGVHQEADQQLPDQRMEYDFDGLRSLQQLVRDAEREGRRVRAVASGHSLSDVAVTADYMVSTRRMTRPQRRADQPYIKADFRDGYLVDTRVGDHVTQERRHLYETGAGTIIKDLKPLLAQEGWALQNLGGSDVQGILGAVSTSTHGSGLGLGPYPNFVKSMVMVVGGGRAIRLEPHDGITDPEAYRQTPEWLEHGIELVQDDALFYSAVVAMGCMGIVFSVVLEVMNLYSLKEERLPSSWEIEKAIIAERGLDYLRQDRHFELTINPYAVDDSGEHFCLVTRRNYVDLDPDQPADERTRRNYLSSLLSGLIIAGPVSAWLFNRQFERIPKLISNSLYRIVDYEEDGGGFCGPYDVVLNQGLGEMKFYGYAIELAFPLEGNLFVQAVDRMLELINQFAQAYKHFHPAPLALRFVDASPAYLSMTYERPACLVEVVSLWDVRCSLDILKVIEREMLAFQARPHWGLNLGYATGIDQDLSRWYPHYDRWLAAYRTFNPHGTFDNRFTDRAGLSRAEAPTPPPPLAPPVKMI